MRFPLRWYPADTQIDLADRVLAFCAEEVRRQGDTPWHVYRMVIAWRWAQERHEADRTLHHATVREIARLIEVGGRHRGLLRQEHGHVGVDARERPAVVADPDVARAIAAFERIHPFFDGNGRTGKVLYNWLRGSLNPVWPPDFFSTPNRRIENGGSGSV